MLVQPGYRLRAPIKRLATIRVTRETIEISHDGAECEIDNTEGGRVEVLCITVEIVKLSREIQRIGIKLAT